MKSDINLMDIIDLQEYARSLDKHWSKVAAHFLILEGETSKKALNYGLLWRRTFDKCLYEVT
jgi:hypothetical protein